MLQFEMTRQPIYRYMARDKGQFPVLFRIAAPLGLALDVGPARIRLAGDAGQAVVVVEVEAADQLSRELGAPDVSV